MKVRRQTGFTIIELLVVVIIIVLLALISTVAFNRTQADTRDRDHQADALTIMEAAEKYYSQNGEYPYAISMNPSMTQGKLPNYDNVLTLMPGLTTASLDGPAGYNFIALSCDSASCPISNSADLALKPNQIIYMASKQGFTESIWMTSSASNMWGCQITFDDTTPAAVIAWRSEATGKYILKITKRHRDDSELFRWTNLSNHLYVYQRLTYRTPKFLFSNRVCITSGGGVYK